MKKGGILLGILLLLQLVPVERENPPVRADFAGPEDVREILVRSCYDCHSHQTPWPWYSRIAPISFFVAHDVNEARDHLNFSEWRTYGAAKRAELMSEMIEKVEKRKMPPPVYVLMHGSKKLSGSELQILRNWVPEPGAGP